MREDVKAIAWDFDGVLNRNIIDGRFVWADTIEEDLGIPFDDFQQGIFDDSFTDVICGKTDLQTHLQDWLDTRSYSIKAFALMEYWFAKDDLKDPLSCDLLDRLDGSDVQQVIATNNERHRASYIENVSGFSEKVSHVFSSGRIGHAKPETAFFHHVSACLNIPPHSLLLIDDNLANISAASELGWDTFHFSDATRLELASYLGF